GRLQIALGAADDLVERRPFRAFAPLVRAARFDGAWLGRIAEREDHLHLAAADARGSVGVADAVRARRDALVPRDEHHVLRRAADVEAAGVADERDDELRRRDVLWCEDRLRELLLRLPADDELPL